MEPALAVPLLDVVIVPPLRSSTRPVSEISMEPLAPLSEDEVMLAESISSRLLAVT
jgi:hypothetical protein